MHRRQFLLGASSLATATGLGLTGCSADGGEQKLTVLASSYDKSVGSGITDQWSDVVKAFGKKHPDIEVDLQLVPFTRIDKELAKRVKEGNPPDISQGNVFAGYAEDGRLFPASDVFKIPVQADFITSFAQAGEVNFAQYGIPFLASTPRLFYNTALFEKAGISGPPRSWEELRTAAQALKRAGVPTPYGLALGPEAAEDEALAWMLAADGGYASTAGYDFVKTENVHALTWLRARMVAKGLAGAHPEKLTRTKAYEGFLKGRIGMLNAHPVLLGTAQKAGFPYAHAAFPKEDGGAAPPVGLSDWLMAFTAGGRREQSAAFLNFLYQVTSVRQYGSGQGTLPVTVSGSRALREDPSGKPLRRFIDQMPDAEFQPVGRTSWPTVRTRVQGSVGKAVDPHGPSPRAVLDALQKAADEADRAARRD
ncbi:ABC transporter substrate-binding protein [Streptomyces reniochalinae]|uniref:Extracellular solute-binding protein n=1 Tax=Streptomyces reniochalinae TaxID=2250578 RepID=A0A367EAB8_9ACTN|nr:extracellular solute-binding protein [Streptomyces reniochalinae]RCG14672.1 extracellular solute-binding protein [Streptomyces reniochalinae]